MFSLVLYILLFMIKTNNPEVNHKKINTCLLTGTSNDAEKYAVSICGSRPKQRSEPSLIFMKFGLCRPSVRHRLLIFCLLTVESRFDIRLCRQRTWLNHWYVTKKPISNRSLGLTRPFVATSALLPSRSTQLSRSRAHKRLLGYSNTTYVVRWTAGDDVHD